MPASSADVAAAVTFARENGLPIAIQGGGHGPAYPADGALLINFMQMTGLQINLEASTVRIEAGLKWAQVIEAAHPFGLALLNGFAPTVGVVGYLLGGGYGWLVRQYGLGASSIRSVDLVTADGRLLLVNEQSYPDLFWGLRGGGGNFGIVTALEEKRGFKQVPHGPERQYPCNFSTFDLEVVFMIVVTTPTSLIGHQVLNNLLASSEPIRVIVRDPSRLPAHTRERVEVVQGSHGDLDVVTQAFAGAHSV